MNHKIKDFEYTTLTNGRNNFVKISHLPTGLYVTNEGLDERSMYKTRQILMSKLIDKINEL